MILKGLFFSFEERNTVETNHSLKGPKNRPKFI